MTISSFYFRTSLNDQEEFSRLLTFEYVSEPCYFALIPRKDAVTSVVAASGIARHQVLPTIIGHCLFCASASYDVRIGYPPLNFLLSQLFLVVLLNSTQ